MKNSQRIFSLALADARVAQRAFTLAQLLITVDVEPLHKKHFALYKLRHARYEFMKANGVRCRRVYGTPKDWK